MRVRREKLDRLRADGVDVYPVSVARTHSLRDIRRDYPDLEPGAQTNVVVGIAGRVIFARNTGKLCFATLREGGIELQVMLSVDRVGPEVLAAWKRDVDLGDQIFVTGEVGTSRRGELSIFANSWRFTAKALRPLPVAHRGMSEELRVRRRYVDLIVREQARRMARDRATVLRTLRTTLDEAGFLEIETPMLQVIPGGASARPFVTHSNALDLELYLRIAPELYLKRAIVGDLERVYELNRNFRNEGVDATHSPEFAMLEFYQSYADYRDVAVLTTRLIQACAQALYGELIITRDDGVTLDLSGEWPWQDFYELVSDAVGEVVDPGTSRAKLAELAARHEIEIETAWGVGRIAEAIFDELVADALIGPVYVADFPVETSPLTREHRSKAGVTEKWDLYIGGVERGTGYSELTDPVEQRARFVAQSELGAAGDDEAMTLDEDFLQSLEYAMPPTGGVGLGIDRLLTVLTDATTLRDTILFPLVRPLSS
ncbi:MAG: lysine--tRNA ligase [Geodermatophilaceae bacterium]|nr:lysine--tRNA ligase [Geodermatophilaceae bacterium]